MLAFMASDPVSEQDVYLFREGTHANVHTFLGCHLSHEGGSARFAVWAPNAVAVSVLGDWLGWNAASHPLTPRPDGSGIWEGEAHDVHQGHAYKYRIAARDGGQVLEKADPVGFYSEHAPATASRAWNLDYQWQDQAWMAQRRGHNDLDSAMAIYEVHLGSWRRKDGAFLNYRELAHALAEYLSDLGFTHVELMPITEHPFYG